MLLIPQQQIEKHFAEIAKIGRLPSGGYDRKAWSTEETAAIDYIAAEGEKAGLKPIFDSVGNLYLIRPGNWNELILTGSHLDTVVNGGNYDGVAGVVTGLEAVKAIIQSDLEVSKGQVVVVWRGEESSSFGIPYKGSRAAFGELDPSILQRINFGKTLEETLIQAKYDPTCIKQKNPSFPSDLLQKIVGSVELHIEQANKLEVDHKDIGIVTSIRGNSRYIVLVKGEFDHSGATPMGKKYRKDANLAIAYMLVAADNLYHQESEINNMDLVQTAGIINSSKDYSTKFPDVNLNELTKISGLGYFTLDIRSSSDSSRILYSEKFKKTISDVAKNLGVIVSIEEIGSSSAVENTSHSIQQIIKISSDNLGYPSDFMPSGAGHDSAIIAKYNTNGTSIPVGMIFIPCKNGKSHEITEYASPQALTKGANVLANTLYKMSV